jgi:nucleoside-diphosphate-sugar epimerase
MKVLFLGGSGVISSASSQLAVDQGMELYVLNRGKTIRPMPENVHKIKADARDEASLLQAVNGLEFDVVVDWIAFTPDQVEMDYRIFQDRTKQFVFISSASAYQTPPQNLPVAEDTPLDNPFWQYSRDKIACENMLMDLYEREAFPVTIVRPSHTYDRTMLPCRGGWTTIDRMRNGQQVIIHGDGASIWTLTHHRDFAKGFVGLLGNSAAIGEDYHITSDEWLSWNQIYEILADAAGAKLDAVHIPSDLINKYDAEIGAGLLGDKMHSMIFDNSKIKAIVPEFECTIPFVEGAKEIINWYDGDPARSFINTDYNELTDKMLSDFNRLLAH